MSTTTLAKTGNRLPVLFDDFFKPWNEWFSNGDLTGRPLSTPAVNIVETKEDYKITLAAPGLKKSDFNIDLDGNMLTISSEKEARKETKEERYTRQEYNYSSFCRSFSVPEDIKQDKIVATYEDGTLELILPKKEDAKKLSVPKHIAIK